MTLTKDQRAELRARAVAAKAYGASRVFDPDTVLALLAEIDRLREERDEWKARAEKYASELRQLTIELACNCDEPYTTRGRHAPNTSCHLVEYIVGVLAETEPKP